MAQKSQPVSGVHTLLMTFAALLLMGSAVLLVRLQRASADNWTEARRCSGRHPQGDVTALAKDPAAFNADTVEQLVGRIGGRVLKHDSRPEQGIYFIAVQDGRYDSVVNYLSSTDDFRYVGASSCSPQAQTGQPGKEKPFTRKGSPGGGR